MNELLTRLETWLRANRPAYLESLHPGLTAEELAILSTSLGVTLPGAFCELYSWRNGQPGRWTPSWKGTFFGWDSFMRAEDVLWDANRLRERLAEWEAENPSQTLWNRQWLPFLEDPRGNYTCVDYIGTFGGRAGQVIYLPHADDGFIAYPSLEAWLETLLASLDAGLWEQDGMNSRMTDENQLRALRNEMNPGYPITLDALGGG